MYGGMAVIYSASSPPVLLIPFKVGHASAIFDRCPNGAYHDRRHDYFHLCEKRLCKMAHGNISCLRRYDDPFKQLLKFASFRLS